MAVFKKLSLASGWQQWLQDGRAAICCWVVSLIALSFHPNVSQLQNATIGLTGLVISNLGAYQIKNKKATDEKVEKNDNS